MKTNDTIKLPANCTALTSQEQREATGGASAETVVKAVVALGVSGALLCVAGVAAGSVLGLFRGQGGLEAAIQDSMDRGRAFIDGALEAGRSLLDQLLPW